MPAGVYRTRQQVIALVQSHADKVTLSFADGKRAAFDLVVCADGYASLRRQTLCPDIARN